MKATLVVSKGVVRLYTAPNTRPNDAESVPAGQTRELDGWWAIGSASELFAPKKGLFQVCYHENGRIVLYPECRDAYGAVIPCGSDPSVPQQEPEVEDVAPGKLGDYATHESNVWTTAVKGE